MYLRGPVFAPLYTSVVDITTASTIDGLRSIVARARAPVARCVGAARSMGKDWLFQTNFHRCLDADRKSDEI